MATLADLIKKRRESGKSVTSSLSYGLKEKFKEKIDPRRFLDQSGILTALFPQLKAYKAGGSKDSSSTKSFDKLSSTPSLVGYPQFDNIENNTKIAAKNTLVLPAMHRDINVMRQNIIKLVKLKGGTPTNKADMYFMNARTQEAAYEAKFKRNKPEKLTKETPLDEKPEDEDGGVILDSIRSMISGMIGGFFGPKLVDFVMKTVFAGAGMALLTSTIVGIVGGMLGKAAVEAKYKNIASWGGTEAATLAKERDKYDPDSEAYKAIDDRIEENKKKFQGFKKEFMESKGFKSSPEKGGTFDFKMDVTGSKSRKPTEEEITEANTYAESKMAEWNATREPLKLPSNKNATKTVPSKEETKPVLGAPPVVLPSAPSVSGTNNPTVGVSETPTPTPTPTPRNLATIVDQASVETKQAQEEVSKTPIVNVVESTKERTINAPPTGSPTLASASVYDTEFLKLLGMGV